MSNAVELEVAAPSSLGLTGVPDEVTRGQVREMLALIGVRADDVTDVHITPSAVFVSMFATDAEGRAFCGADGEPAMHTFAVRVSD